MLNRSGESPANHEVDTLKIRNSLKKGLIGLSTLALVVTLASCAESQREPEGTSSEGAADSTFVFAGSADPLMLDPALASDGETFRPARQMFEGLVGAAPGTTDVEPLLATKWETTDGGKTHTFTLREGVKFHDGTDFNAEAVCANFDRWYNWTGAEPDREHLGVLQPAVPWVQDGQDRRHLRQLRGDQPHRRRRSS